MQGGVGGRYAGINDDGKSKIKYIEKRRDEVFHIIIRTKRLKIETLLILYKFSESGITRVLGLASPLTGCVALDKPLRIVWPGFPTSIFH